MHEVCSKWGSVYYVVQVAEHCLAIVHWQSMRRRVLQGELLGASVSPCAGEQPVYLVQYARHYPFDAPQAYSLHWAELLRSSSPTGSSPPGQPYSYPPPPVPGPPSGQPNHTGLAAATAPEEDEEGDISLGVGGDDVAPPYTPCQGSRNGGPHESSPEGGAAGCSWGGTAQAWSIIVSMLCALVASSACSSPASKRGKPPPLPPCCSQLHLASIGQWSCVNTLADIMKDLTG